MPYFRCNVLSPTNNINVMSKEEESFDCYMERKFNEYIDIIGKSGLPLWVADIYTHDPLSVSTIPPNKDDEDKEEENLLPF